MTLGPFHRQWVVVGVAILAGGATGVRAQNDVTGIVPGSAATSTDAYGNAQSGLPERRPLGIFRFDRGGRSGGGALLNQNPNRRGGGTLFSLPGDLLGLSTMATLSNTVSPGVAADIPRLKAQSFSSYGGFGTRFRDRFQDPISAAFERRYALINATSEAAPVYRALAENSSLAGVRTAVVQTPFVPEVEQSALDSPVSLFQRLDAKAASKYERIRKEAWGLFHDGAYRPASRAFQSVLVLQPDDLSARIGEVFSHINLGAIRTATVIVRNLGSHADNVFSADIDMTEQFGDVQQAEQLANEMRLALETVAVDRSADLEATFILVLWYLGNRDEALRFADQLPRREGASAYADWPEKMRAADAG